jgi:acyl carrier protein
MKAREAQLAGSQLVQSEAKKSTQIAPFGHPQVVLTTRHWVQCGPQGPAHCPFLRRAYQLVQAQMYAMQPIELIAEFLHDRLGAQRQQVVESAVLTDLGVDSLMLAELMFEAEDRLGIVIDADMVVPQTVGQMAALIDSLLASKASAS